MPAPSSIERTHRNVCHAKYGPWFVAIVAAFAVVVIAAAPARAEDPWTPPPHVRPQTSDARDLLADATARSPLVHAMVDRLEHSDVVVYIRYRRFIDSQVHGWIGMLSVIAGRRYLVIELASGRVRFDEIATLGHELHHALEIAGEPSIVDARSLAAYYTRVGIDTGGHAGGGRTFETVAAQQAGLQVRRDVFTRTMRTAEDK
jgi:hypothetical protein